MIERGLFQLPIGVDFARNFVAGFLERMADAPPEDIARCEIYLNSGRMQRRVRDEFDRHGAALLPRLRLITDVARQPFLTLPVPVSGLRRRLELAQLVQTVVARLPGFEAGMGVFGLADSLATLMAEMHDQGISPEAFDALEISETHAEHWRRSLAFIRIVARFFDAESPPDTDARQRLAIEARIATWQITPPEHPVIIAGSTGSRGATALFLKAIAALPKGAVVLPGFDETLPESSWNSLDSGATPLEDHPQYRLHCLLRDLAVAPAEVTRWHSAAPAHPARNALLSMALRPAPVTDQWLAEGPTLGPLAPACEGLSLITAPTPRAEADAIALILRKAVETGQKAALISPDRTLTRRVSAALARWGVIADDSAGNPLHHSAPGRFLRHLAQMRGKPLSLEALLIALKHPLTATGSTQRGLHLRYTRELEIHMRRNGPAFPDPATLRAWVKAADPDRARWVEWLIATMEGVETAPIAPLSACIETHLRLATSLAAGPGGQVEASELWLTEAGGQSLAILEELAREAPHAGSYSASDYAELLTRLFQQVSLRQTLTAHPDVTILGTLEARAHDADLVIMAGLNEGSWPATAAPDPWLSRKMRLDLGLLLPERQIGLAAHDFQIALGAPEVVLTRSRRDAEAETIPSRWLNRLTNLLNGLPEQGGQEALKAMEARGETWLRLARALATPTERPAPASRPAPRPPAEARPRELPVTAIKTLIRDPYAVYAGRILRLKPLDPLRPSPDPRLRGQALHLIVETFVKERPPEESLENGVERLLGIAQTVLDETVPWPSARRLWLSRITRIAQKFVRDETLRAARGTPALIEKKGSVSLKNTLFTLTAKPDRIDVLADGAVQIYDYKSGDLPSNPQVEAFDKQLPLEAAMAARGAFTDLGPREVAAMTYIRLGGEGECRDVQLPSETVEGVWERLEQLIAAYLDPKQGFSARRALFEQKSVSDYDHLSRFGEWDMTAAADGEDVG